MRRPRDQVFISYSHLDSNWLRKLQTMLRPLVRNGVISLWADTDIKPGAKWKQVIEEQLASARVAVLLVSDNFLASDFVAQNELPPLLNAAEKEGVEILWVALSHCLFEETEIRDYQAVNNPIRPLDSLPEAEQKEALANICRKIKEAATTPNTAELASEKAQQLKKETVRLEAEIRDAVSRADWSATVASLEHLLKIDPAHKDARTRLNHAKSQQALATNYASGNGHYQNGDLFSALMEFRTVREQDINYKDVQARIANIQGIIEETKERLSAAAQSAVIDCDWGRATESLEALLKLNPLDEEVKLKLREANQNQKKVLKYYHDGLTNLKGNTDLDRALQCLRKVRALGGRFRDVEVLIGETESKIHQRDEERKLEEAAIKEKIRHLTAEAEAAIVTGEWDSAVRSLRAARELNRTDEQLDSRLKFAEYQNKLRTLYSDAQAQYTYGNYEKALNNFRELDALEGDYQDVPALIPTLEKKLAKLENKLVWDGRIFLFKYFGSLTVSHIGILASLIGLVLWIRGSLPQLSGTALFWGTVVSWLIGLYALKLNATVDFDAPFGCLPMLTAVAVPLVAILVLLFAPALRINNANTYIAGAGTLFQNKKYDEAISYLNRAININPGNAQAYDNRGRVYRMKGDYDRAIADISRAMQLDGKNAKFFVNRAWAYFGKQDSQNAFNDFYEAITRAPNDADNYYSRGLAYFWMKKYDLAITDFTSASKVKPEFAEAFDYLGWTYFQSGNYDNAIAYLSKALEKNPKFTLAYLHRGQVFKAKKEFDAAINDFSCSIDAGENLAEAYLERGQAYMHRNQADDYIFARRDLINATNKSPQNAEAFYSLGWAHFKLKDYDQAAKAFDASIKINSQYASPHYGLSEVHLAQTNYPLAISESEKAINLSVDFSRAYFIRGVAYESSGDKGRAIADFRKVVELNKEQVPSAKEHLQRLGAQK